MCSAFSALAERLGFLSVAVVIAGWRRNLVSYETSKAERRSSGDHGSIWDSWPIAFYGYPRRLESVARLGARSTQRLTFRLRLALEPERRENSTATAREDSLHGSRLDPRHSSCFRFQLTGVGSGSLWFR